jgi:lysine-ketoglutarate reductase/saccharopine dehydrogenase-like protein (TIGR00300 family)
MEFKLPHYTEPDFNAPCFAGAKEAAVAAAEKDGVAPDNYHATSIFPEYFYIGGQWRLAQESRMDCVAVVREDSSIAVKEFRNLKKGDRVVIGRTEDGSEGIYVHTSGFENAKSGGDAFAFRTGRSRETAYSKDYDHLYELLRHEKEHGFVVWVLGPACVFDADSRAAMSALIAGGYVDAVLAGNALGTHDLEGAFFRTALGQDIYTQESCPNGHYHHIDVLNRVRRSGSVRQFVEDYGIKDGILYSCLKHDVPFVLTGSIRDDGPLPEVFADVYEGQNNMRKYISQATTVIGMATQLHTIASGNMTPSYRVVDGAVRPTYFYSVDISEFAVNKLRDRGSLSVTTIVTNIQDFLVNVQRGVGLK